MEKTTDNSRIVKLEDIVVRPGEILVELIKVEAKRKSNLITNVVGTLDDNVEYPEHPWKAVLVKKGTTGEGYDSMKEGCILYLREPGRKMVAEGKYDMVSRFNYMIIEGKIYQQGSLAEVMTWERI